MKGRSTVLRGRFPRIITPYFVLVLSLLTTGVTYVKVRELFEDRDHARFNDLVGSAQESIKQRVNRYVDECLGIRGFYAANRQVDRQEWHRFVNSLEIQRRYPGIEYVGYSEQV